MARLALLPVEAWANESMTALTSGFRALMVDDTQREREREREMRDGGGGGAAAAEAAAGE